MNTENNGLVKYGLMFVVAAILLVIGLQLKDHTTRLVEESSQMNMAAARSVPLTPSLTLTPLNQSSITLAWTNTNARSAYSVERSFVQDGQFNQITTVGKGISNYTDSSLSPSTVYYYRIREIIQKGRSISYGAYSNIATARTLEPDSIPPTTQITSPSNGQTLVGMITVSASASDNVGVARVELWKDNVLVSTDTVAPYNFSVDYPLTTTSRASLVTKAFDAANNSGSSGEVSVTVVPDTSSSQISADNVLVVYNTDSTESVEIKDYYVANRPEFARANVLGVSTEDVEITSQTTFESTIRKPIVDWFLQNPAKQIYYIVLLRGIPDRLSGGTSVQLRITTALSDLGIRTGAQYGGSSGAPYTPSKYPGTTALVTHLNMGSQEATKAYIDKLKAMYGRMSTPNILISAEGAGVGGTNYYLDEAQGYAGWLMIQRDRDGLTSLGVASSRIQYTPQTSTTHITSGTDVLGYVTWGANGGIGGDYANNGSVVFNGNSNWYLIKTIESFNGQWNTGQGNFVDWFSSNAFGGTNYSNTPVGATTHIEEPYVTGVASPSYLRNWEKGMTFAEAVWDSRSTPYFMAVGDPMVKR
jgi:Bacterial Ig domain